MSKDRSCSPRPWPIVVISGGGILHISRANAGGFKVRTECGRTIGNTSMYRGDPKLLRDCDGKVVRGVHNFEGPFKICQRCGCSEDFATAQQDFLRIHGEEMKRIQEWRDARAEAVSRMQGAIRATMMSTLIPEGSQDMENDGWGVMFTYNGTRFRLSPSEEECKRLHVAAEESACPSTDTKENKNG